LNLSRCFRDIHVRRWILDSYKVCNIQRECTPICHLTYDTLSAWRHNLTPQRTLHSPHTTDKLNMTILEVFGQQRPVRKSYYLHITINQLLMLITEPYSTRLLKLKFRKVFRFWHILVQLLELCIKYGRFYLLELRDKEI